MTDHKIGMNLMINCPACGSLMIIANPLKQTGNQAEHKIAQKCGDCKNTITMWLEVKVVMWRAKPEEK